MDWSREKPSHPGFYWVAEADKSPHVVKVDFVSDSHQMLFVVVPGDNAQYPLDLWHGVRWCGPLEFPNL